MSDKKKQIAINTHLLHPIVFCVIFILLAIFSAKDEETWLAVGFAAFTLLPLFVFLISPMYYVFSEEGVKIVYLWGQKEEIEWTFVRSIEIEGNWMVGRMGFPHYHVAYPQNKKLMFFMNGDISKTRKTKKLIKKYYKKYIA